MTTQKSPTCLFILDGWGHSESTQHNPCITAKTPFIDDLFQTHPNRLIEASGEVVGLPAGQIGNSEVGHLHLGAGRLVPQDLTRINQAIDNNTLANNATLQQAIHIAKKNNKPIHILGLCSDGGVHSHIQHIIALINIIRENGLTSYTHAFLDGRDVLPQSATPSLTALIAAYEHANGHIASLCGRYYAMDRDNRWERIQRALDCLLGSNAKYTATDALTALQAAYDRGETDEFVQPTHITTGNDVISIQPDDVVIHMNFRADRARQLTQKLSDAGIESLYTLTKYSRDCKATALFEPLALKNTLGKVISDAGLSQLRIAETEKYAHVTYFFNGGDETPNPGESRELIPSPRVATYDQQPAMHAALVTEKIKDAICNNQYDVIICNFANPDMVGHTGNEPAAIIALETIDACLAALIPLIQQYNGQAFITADHGNIESMHDTQSGQPNTAHTTNPVPLIYVGLPATFDDQPASLKDIAPTLLYSLDIPIPHEMTGSVLLHSQTSA